MDPTGPLARRFPLVARPRPACDPLNVRVTRLCALAGEAQQLNDPVTASAVHNQAALLASDLGLPALARSWCHRHAAAYLHAHPLGAQAARNALEPLVNLARLHIRDGNGDQAHQLLTTLYQAVTSRTDTVIEGHVVPASTLTATDDDHREVTTWLWSVLLADGARALTNAGRWHDAYAHLQQHKGIGQRMLDGRQVAVIAALTADDPDRALALLAATLPGELPENAVTACLTVLARTAAGMQVGSDTRTMLDLYHRLDPTPGLAVFHARLGLSVIDAAADVENPEAERTAEHLIAHAIAQPDGYAASELLAHGHSIALLTNDDRRQLTAIVAHTAIGGAAIPPVLGRQLGTALAIAEVVIARTPATARG